MLYFLIVFQALFEWMEVEIKEKKLSFVWLKRKTKRKQNERKKSSVESIRLLGEKKLQCFTWQLPALLYSYYILTRVSFCHLLIDLQIGWASRFGTWGYWGARLHLEVQPIWDPNFLFGMVLLQRVFFFFLIDVRNLRGSVCQWIRALCMGPPPTTTSLTI